MSERSFRRDRERRVAAERRRDANRARKAAAAAAAAGAFVLAAPAVSSAATFTVTQTNDGPSGTTTCVAGDTVGPCNLRDAIDAAGAAVGADDIVFAAAISGDTITLNSGRLVVNDNYPLTIYGGATPDSIYIDGNGDSMVFDTSSDDLTLSGLTIQNGDDGPAGGIYVEFGDVLLTNSVVTGNTAEGAQVDNYTFAGGGGITNRGNLTVDNSTIGGATLGDGNYSDVSQQPYPVFGGGGIENIGDLTVTHSTITGNGASMSGGGIFNGFTNYPTSLDVSDTTIDNNFAYEGGGIASANFLSKYSDVPVGNVGGNHLNLTNSTVSGNHAFIDGGGIGIKYLGGSTRWKIDHSTISGNDTFDNNGGGLSVGYFGFGPGAFSIPNSGSLEVVDSTISGNLADNYGGGVMVNRNAQKYEGTVKFKNSTIASNQAYDGGGGIYQAYTTSDGDYAPYFGASLFSTIVGDNTLDGGTPSDLEQGTDAPSPGDTPFELSFSLVEAPLDSILNQNPAGSNLIGVDAQLGALANNGGPTLTQLPSINSPVVDKGSAPGDLTTDQRGQPRTVDTSPANAHDGTDIGSVELPAGPPGPPPPAGQTKVGTLKKKHKKRRRVVRTKHKVAKVRLTFRSNDPTVTFKCSVDGGPFAACTSPFVTPLTSAPGKGKNHNISIQQVDSSGNPVGNVRVFKFRVVLKD
jgi:putative cofactor-binding repeat protein